jgi:hypothetical protein
MALAREQGSAIAQDMAAVGQASQPQPRLRRRLARTGIPALAAVGGLAALAASRAAARRA